MTQPSEQLASAPGKTYLFMKMPLSNRVDVSEDWALRYNKNVPDQVLVLPCRTKPCDLQNENTIVVQEVVDLSHESAISPNADVLATRYERNADRSQWKDSAHELVSCVSPPQPSPEKQSS